MSDRKSAWGAYWQTGQLHSSGTRDTEQGYSAAIAQYWRAALGGISAQSSVLNVGCGNGALERLFVGRAGPAFDGIDLAEVQTGWVQGLSDTERARFRFFSATPVEELPFADDRYAAVVSQYGIEYADAERAWPELIRVARPGAKLQLLLHHRDSVLVKTSTEEAAHCQWLRDSGLLEATTALLPYLAMSTTRAGQRRLAQDAQARTLRKKYNLGQAELQQRAEASLAPQLLHEFAAGLHGVVSTAQSQGRDAAEAVLRMADLQLEQAALRYGEILVCALGQGELDAYMDNLRARGLQVVNEGPLRDEGHTLGWKVGGVFPA